MAQMVAKMVVFMVLLSENRGLLAFSCRVGRAVRSLTKSFVVPALAGFRPAFFRLKAGLRTVLRRFGTKISSRAIKRCPLARTGNEGKSRNSGLPVVPL